MIQVNNLKCDKTQNVIKLKLWCNSNCDETHVTQIVIKLKNLKREKIQKLILCWNLKTQMVTKLKKSNCDKTQKLRLWQNSKKSKCDKTWKLKQSNYDKTQVVTKLKLWQKSNFDKNQNVTKIKLWSKNKETNSMGQKSNCEKTQEFKVWQISKPKL